MLLIDVPPERGADVLSTALQPSAPCGENVCVGGLPRSGVSFSAVSRECDINESSLCIQLGVFRWTRT